MPDTTIKRIDARRRRGAFSRPVTAWSQLRLRPTSMDATFRRRAAHDENREEALMTTAKERSARGSTTTAIEPSSGPADHVR